jgi:hypothetical protein
VVVSRERFPFVAIPVFPSRVFRHGFIFVNTNSGIREYMVEQRLLPRRVPLEELLEAV